MLIQFNFQNYKSFRDETSLDLSATKITEHTDHVVNIANDKLLKVAAIYGANASGKSNVHHAFEHMSYYVIDSFKFGDEDESRQKSNTEDRINVTPFLFGGKSREEETTFEVFYIDNSEDTGRTYQYGFSIKESRIVEEWLYSKAKTARNQYRTVFYRKGDHLDLSGLKNKIHEENIKLALNPEVLIVSLGAKLKIEKLKKVRDWFWNNEVLDFGNIDEDFFRSRVLPKNFTRDAKVQKNVIDYFASFDDAIHEFEVKKSQLTDEEDARAKFQINALHKMTDSDEHVPLPLKLESSGTLKMFSLYPSLKHVLDCGGILFVDELNARLHPLLVRNIILTFLSTEINAKNAQLIFTTHDVWQFSNELLRRDEIWMVNKNKDGASELYSLSDFKDEDGGKVRRNEALAKNYLTGNYGAIPALKPMMELKEEAADGE